MNIITNKIGATDFRIGGTDTTIEKAYLGDTLVWEIGSGSDVDFGDWDLIANVEYAELLGLPNVENYFYDRLYGNKCVMFVPNKTGGLEGVIKVKNISTDPLTKPLYEVLRYDDDNYYSSAMGKLKRVEFLYINWDKIQPSNIVYDLKNDYLKTVIFQPSAYIRPITHTKFHQKIDSLINCKSVEYLDFSEFDTSKVEVFKYIAPTTLGYNLRELNIEGWSTAGLLDDDNLVSIGESLISLSPNRIMLYLWVTKDFFAKSGCNFTMPVGLFSDTTNPTKTRKCAEQMVLAMIDSNNNMFRIACRSESPIEYIKSIAYDILVQNHFTFGYNRTYFYYISRGMD